MAGDDRSDALAEALRRLGESGAAPPPELVALARGAPAAVEERVFPMLGDERAAVRAAAVRLLAEVPDRTRLLRALLVHCRGLACWLRERSLDAIRAIPGGIVEPLLELMRPGEEPEVRVGAMLLARGSTDPRCAPLVREIFGGDLDWWARATAAEVLAADPGAEVTRLLLSRIGDAQLRHAIIGLLAGREGEEAAAALRGCVEDPACDIRCAGLAALARRGGADALEAIGRVAAADPDPGVRARAAALIAPGGGPGGGAADPGR